MIYSIIHFSIRNFAGTLAHFAIFIQFTFINENVLIVYIKKGVEYTNWRLWLIAPDSFISKVDWLALDQFLATTS